MRRLWILLLVFVLALGARTFGTQAQPPVAAEVSAINRVTALADRVGLYDKLELVADIDAVFNNPYDPANIRVDGRFTSPSGATVVVPGFYYRDYSYGGGRLRAGDEWSWRVRFTPTEVGEWQYQVLATTLKGTTRSQTGTFTVTPSDNPGFVRVDPRNPRYFAFDDGTPYFPVGENIGWSSGDPIASYATWLDKLSTAGGNFARVWMAPWGFDIEWSDTGLGNYDNRQGAAYQLDQVMDLMAQHHVYVMLSLLNHGQFSTTTNPEWDENPFNAANGGPLQNPQDFATNPEAIRLWNQRLRYIAARWGYSPNIMTWEWWNEVNWTPLVDADLLAPWAARSAAYLRSLDPYRHLISTSGSPLEDETVWGQANMDFTQAHRYDMDDLLLTFSQIIPNWLARYPNKPFLMGEFGRNSDPSESDPQGVELHLGLWDAPMNGAAGTAMTWWWDSYIDPLNLYDQFAGIAAFFGGEDMGARRWQPAAVALSDPDQGKVLGLQSPDEALLWVVNRDYSTQYLKSEYARALRSAIRASNRGQVVAGFEDGLDGWMLVPDWAAGETMEQSSEGDHALALTATYTGGSWQEAGVGVQPGGADWSHFANLTIDIYVPVDAGDFIAQVYTKTGDGWAWSNSADIALTAGEWNKLSIPLSDLGDASDVHEAGIKIGSSTAQFSGTFLIDNVKLSGAGAPVTPVIEFPTVAGAVLSASGFAPGTYTVELWDTVSGQIVDTSSVEAVDGTVAIPLPDFNTDLAIKVKAE